MTINIKAETLKETTDRFIDAVMWLFTNRKLVIPMQGKKRGKIGYFFHTAMNVVTEAVRRNAQFAAKTILFGFPAVITIYEWGNLVMPK